MARLASRYLVVTDRADARDLAKWARLSLGEARVAFDAITGQTVERADGLIDLAGREPPGPLPAPRLLGPFDPLLLGWSSREPFVGAHRVVTTNGIFRACALVDGSVVGTWRLNGTTLTITPLEKLKVATIKALRADAADVVRFLGLSDRPQIVVETG